MRILSHALIDLLPWDEVVVKLCGSLICEVHGKEMRLSHSEPQKFMMHNTCKKLLLSSLLYSSLLATLVSYMLSVTSPAA